MMTNLPPNDFENSFPSDAELKRELDKWLRGPRETEECRSLPQLDAILETDPHLSDCSYCCERLARLARRRGETIASLTHDASPFLQTDENPWTAEQEAFLPEPKTASERHPRPSVPMKQDSSRDLVLRIAVITTGLAACGALLLTCATLYKITDLQQKAGPFAQHEAIGQVAVQLEQLNQEFAAAREQAATRAASYEAEMQAIDRAPVRLAADAPPRELRNQPLRAVYSGDSGVPEYIAVPPPPSPSVDVEQFSSAREPNDELGERLYVFDDAPSAFLPVGFMPDGQGVAQNTQDTRSPHSGRHCVSVRTELSAQTWIGLTWLLDGTWEPTRNFNLEEALDVRSGDSLVLRFWARSDDQAVVQFKVGGVTVGSIVDTLRFPVVSPWIRLTPEWRRYEIDLAGKNVQSIVGGFSCCVDRQHNGLRDIGFCVDTVYFVKIDK